MCYDKYGEKDRIYTFCRVAYGFFSFRFDAELGTRVAWITLGLFSFDVSKTFHGTTLTLERRGEMRRVKEKTNAGAKFIGEAVLFHTFRNVNNFESLKNDTSSTKLTRDANRNSPPRHKVYKT